MKMTFDLPQDIVQRLKLKAAAEGLKMKDLVAEACRDFLSRQRAPKRRAFGPGPFPIFKGGRPAAPGTEMTPERVAEILYGGGEQ